MYAGNWITGSIGAKKIEALTQSLDKAHLEQTNLALGQSWNEYAPWMSCEDNLEYFKTAFADNKRLASKVVNNKKDLVTIADGLLYNDAPLGKLRLPAVDQFKFNYETVVADSQEIEAAVLAVKNISETFQIRFNSLSEWIVPIDFAGHDRIKIGRGLSSHFFRKGIFLQPPSPWINSRYQLALNLVHEMGHQALITYQNADKIIEENRECLVISVVRGVERPAIRSFHALVVIAYMLEFLFLIEKQSTAWRATHCPVTRDYLTQEIVRYRSLLLSGVASFRKSEAVLSKLGSQILDEIETLASVGISQ